MYVLNNNNICSIIIIMSKNILSNIELEDENKETPRVRCFNNKTNRPKGGFPPIYICDENSIIINSGATVPRRGFSTDKKISIKTILAQKRNAHRVQK